MARASPGSSSRWRGGKRAVTLSAEWPLKRVVRTEEEPYPESTSWPFPQVARREEGSRIPPR